MTDAILRRSSRACGAATWRCRHRSAEFWQLTPGANAVIGLNRRAPGGHRARGRRAGVSSRHAAEDRERSARLRAGARRLSELPVRQQRLPRERRRRAPMLADLQILMPRVVVLLRTAPGTDRFTAALSAAGAGDERAAARVAQPRAGSAESRQRHVHFAGARQHAHLPGRRTAAGAGRDPRRCDRELQRRSANAGAASHSRRVAAGAVAASCWRRCCRRRSSAWRSAPLPPALAGFGLANYVWQLREMRTVVQLLPTHLVVPPLTGWPGALARRVAVGVASGFSWWAFRHTAHTPFGAHEPVADRSSAGWSGQLTYGAATQRAASISTAASCRGRSMWP